MAQVLSTPLESPFDLEIILVQSHGMARWISTELARHYGISAHHKFYYPNEFMNEVLQTVQTEIDTESTYMPAIMTWKIMQLLPACLDKPGFESLKKYLLQDDMAIREYQLAIRIADLFDQYLLFRPEMIFKWERGEADHWQALLWRELYAHQTDDHRAALFRRFQTLVNESPQKIIGLPRRISVFGISALPRFHMDFFAALSGVMAVNMFFVNPCREYWGVIQSDHDIKKTTRRSKSGEEAWLYLEQGNRLLASLGTIGRDFFDLLNDYQCQTIEMFDPVKEESLLSWLQSDILNLRDGSSDRETPIMIDGQDTSVTIHSCHSPMREVEVLQDRLLHLFEQDPDLSPGDILVMTPDIDIYAPFIHAVFQHGSDSRKTIPYRITDRSMIAENRVIKTVFLIFKLYKSRFKASDVLRIVESPLVLKRFDMTPDDAALIRQWVVDAGIRWGQDTSDLTRLHLPEFRENTWSAGIERLLLGYAMKGGEENMVAGILPYDHIEGSSALVLGKFLEFTERLFSFVTALDRLRTLTEWSEVLSAIPDIFFSQDDDAERELRAFRAAVSHLTDIQNTAEFSREIPFSLVEHHLTTAFSGKGSGSGFISSGVTFCTMLPMRSIPFKVICLLGMNHDAYPRQNKTSEFDLIAKHPRPGDRSGRLEDLYIFLESMLSARKRLYISYIGRNIQDNSEIPPSVIVSELLDYIENRFSVQDMNIVEHLTVKHRLQPFHPDYFKNQTASFKKMFSYSREFCRAAEYLLHPVRMDRPFFAHELPEPDEAFQHIHLDDLCLFFGNPAKYLVTRRLGIYLEEGRGTVEDKESFLLSPLDQYNLAQQLLTAELSGKDPSLYRQAVRASGRLPHGTAGTCMFDTIKERVSDFAENSKPFLQEDPLPFPPFSLNIGPFTLSGTISNIFPGRHLLFRFAQKKARDIIRIWLHHLVLSLLKPDGFSGQSMFIGLDGRSANDRVWKAWELGTVDTAGQHLENMLTCYWEGLKRPLKFFPEASYLYANQMIHKHQNHETAFIRAKTRYEGSAYQTGESDDFYYQLCFSSVAPPNETPIDDEFADLSMRVFQPIHDCLQEIK